MKKNGFTLIEVLGVIILLGVLSVIVVPVVRDSIKQSKRKAYDKQVNTILTTAREWAADNTSALTEGSFLVKVETLKKAGLIENKDIINPVNNEEMKGCAKVSYNQGFNQYEYEYLDSCMDGQILTSEDDCINDRKGICNPGTLVNVQVNDSKNYNFYVISDDGNELTMIMDRNLYSDEDVANGTQNVAWISAEDYESANSEEGDNISCDYEACFDEGPVTALNALKERTNDWTNIDEREYIVEHSLYGSEYYSIIRTMRARLLTTKEAMSEVLGCNYQPGNCISWLYNGSTSYWTSDMNPSLIATAQSIRNGGNISDVGVTSYSGIRPVITVPKNVNIY